MSKKVIAFGNTEIEKLKFRHHKKLILLEDVDTDSILISSLISSGKKNYK